MGILRIRNKITDLWMILAWASPFNLEITHKKGRVNLFSPHDALKYHFTSLKTYLIFSQLRVLEDKSR